MTGSAGPQVPWPPRHTGARSGEVDTGLAWRRDRAGQTRAALILVRGTEPAVGAQQLGGLGRNGGAAAGCSSWDQPCPHCSLVLTLPTHRWCPTPHGTFINKQCHPSPSHAPSELKGPGRAPQSLHTAWKSQSQHVRPQGPHSCTWRHQLCHRCPRAHGWVELAAKRMVYRNAEARLPEGCPSGQGGDKAGLQPPGTSLACPHPLPSQGPDHVHHHGKGPRVPVGTLGCLP